VVTDIISDVVKMLRKTPRPRIGWSTRTARTSGMTTASGTSRATKRTVLRKDFWKSASVSSSR
jgi:hypothetical protein